MKANPCLLVLCSISVAVMVPGCSGQEKPPASRPTVIALVDRPAEAPEAGPEVAPKWADLKEIDFAGKARVLAGLAWIEQAVDRRIADFNERRIAMKNDQVDWDIAMRTVMSDRAYLRSMAVELAATTAATWSDRKEKVGRALEALEVSFGKVSRSTTS